MTDISISVINIYISAIKTFNNTCNIKHFLKYFKILLIKHFIRKCFNVDLSRERKMKRGKKEGWRMAWAGLERTVNVHSSKDSAAPLGYYFLLPPFTNW